MAYSECLPTRLNPLAERTCFSQADAQLFLVTLVGLVLRIRPDELAKDPFSEGVGFTQVCSTYRSTS